MCICAAVQLLGALSDDDHADSSDSTGERRRWEEGMRNAGSAAHDGHHPRGTAHRSYIAQSQHKQGQLLVGPKASLTVVCRKRGDWTCCLIAVGALSDAVSMESDEDETGSSDDGNDKAWGPEMATPARGWRGASARRQGSSWGCLWILECSRANRVSPGCVL